MKEMVMTGTEIFVKKFLNRMEKDSKSGKVLWTQAFYEEGLMPKDPLSTYLYRTLLEEDFEVCLFNILKEPDGTTYKSMECLEVWLRYDGKFKCICSTKKNPQLQADMKSLFGTLEAIFNDINLPDGAENLINRYMRPYKEKYGQKTQDDAGNIMRSVTRV